MYRNSLMAWGDDACDIIHAAWKLIRRLDQALGRDVEPLIQLPDHLQSQRALVVQHLVDPVHPADHGLYIDFYDPDHSCAEHRYLIIGESGQRRLLLVSYTERGNVIRLISAREATRTERKVYEEG